MPGYLQCMQENDLIEIVNAGQQFNAIVKQKINQQKCARNAIGERVNVVIRKALPNGLSYSCYQEELNVLTPAYVHCSLNQYFMSLQEFLAAKSPQYSVTARTGERVFARCVNDAVVILEQRPGYFLRTVQMPFTGMVTGEPTEVRASEREALLGGCRGDDFLRNQ